MNQGGALAAAILLLTFFVRAISDPCWGGGYVWYVCMCEEPTCQDSPNQNAKGVSDAKQLSK